MDNLLVNSFPEIAKEWDYEKNELSNLYWEGDPTHFNKSGNKVWADLFFVYLKNSGIFKQ